MDGSSSNISIHVQEDDEKEVEEEDKKAGTTKMDSSLIGLETLKDAVNLGAPMNTAV